MNYISGSLCPWEQILIGGRKIVLLFKFLNKIFIVTSSKAIWFMYLVYFFTDLGFSNFQEKNFSFILKFSIQKSRLKAKHVRFCQAARGKIKNTIQNDS